MASLAPAPKVPTATSEHTTAVAAMAAADQKITRSVRPRIPGRRSSRSVMSITAPPTASARRSRRKRSPPVPAHDTATAPRNTAIPDEALRCHGHSRARTPSTAWRATSTTTSASQAFHEIQARR